MKPRNTVLTTMILIFSLSILGCFLCFYFYQQAQIAWFFTIGVVFFSVAIHFLIMFISAPVVFMLFRNKYNCNSFWFKQKPFEKTLYRILKIKKWKNKLPAYDRNEYSLQLNNPETIAQNMCHAEVVHEVIALASYLPILFGLVISNYGLLTILSMFFSIIHLVFVFIQRYNRPRFIRLSKKIQL